MIATWLLAAVGLTAAIYAHTHVAAFTLKPLPLHALLLLTGACVGYVAMDRSGTMAVAGFLAGFAQCIFRLPAYSL